MPFSVQLPSGRCSARVRIDAASEIPGPLNLAVEQVVGTIRPPVELARGEVDRGACQWCGQRVARGIAETRMAGIRIGIEARDRSIVTSGHPAAAAIELPAEFADFETPGKPAAHGLLLQGSGLRSLIPQCDLLVPDT